MEKKLIVSGKRLDGRELDQFRQIEAKVGILKRAGGSALFGFGHTIAIAAVYGPRSVHPRHMQDPQMAILRCRYNMAPFSTQERVAPKPSRRSIEISKVINKALSEVIFFDEYPKTMIDVFMEILEADASTRCAAINAASLALADAGIPMRDLVCSCSVGKIDGQIVLDVGGLEDNYGEVDIAVATIPTENKILLLQLDGIITKEEFLKALALAQRGCEQIYKIQKQALKSRYSGEGNDVENE